MVMSNERNEEWKSKNGKRHVSKVMLSRVTSVVYTFYLKRKK